MINKEQNIAVEHKKGPLMIIAGAGTGKTFVLTKRIAHIISKEWAKSDEILAMTFTEKAALEMKERVEKELGGGYYDLNISTFHGFCDRFLRDEGLYIGLDTGYQIVTDTQRNVLFKKHLFDFELEDLVPINKPYANLNKILSFFDRLADYDITPDIYLERVEMIKSSHQDEDIDEVEAQENYRFYKRLGNAYKKWEEIRIENSMLTFADLISFTLKTLREKPSVKAKYNKLFKYVLVDEFQDTNTSQAKLIEELTNSDQNITVVGDDDQSIYMFRGASIENILDFTKTYPKAKKVVLNKNYRSRQEILDLAYESIQFNNPKRLEIQEDVQKKLIASNEEMLKLKGQAVSIFNVKNTTSEAEIIAKKILQLKEEGVGYDDMAILYRSESHCSQVLQHLRHYNVPFKFQGKKGIFSRPEVRDLISMLRVLADTNRDESFFDILAMESFEIDSQDILKIFACAKSLRINPYQVAQRLSFQDEANLPKQIVSLNSKLDQRTLESIQLIIEQFKKFSEMLKQELPVSQIVYEFINFSKIFKLLTDENNSDPLAYYKVQNVSKFLNTVLEFEQSSEYGNIFQVIDYIDSSIDAGESPSDEDDLLEDLDAVNLLTAHRSKGLEFDHVFVINMVDGRFPLTRGGRGEIDIPLQLHGGDVDQEVDLKEMKIHEERRLFYVAATRAKKSLYLTIPKRIIGNKTDSKPSRFLAELEENISFTNEESETQIDSNGKADTDVFVETSDDRTGELDSDTNREIYLNEDFAKKLSYSAMSTYENCPWQFRYSKVYGLRGAESHVFSYGSSIHAAMQYFYKNQIRYHGGEKDFEAQLTLKELLALLDRHWIVAGYLSLDHMKARKKKAKEVLTEFYEKRYSVEDRVVKVEEYFEVSVGDIVVNGMIDRIDMIEGGKVKVVDYKTGSVKKDKKDMAKYENQVALYSMALEKVGYEVGKAELYFVEEDEIVEIEDFEGRKEELVPWIEGIAKDIREYKFEPNPGFNCHYCSFNQICDHSTV